MKRVFSTTGSAQGGVYRSLPDGVCLAAPVLVEITPPGCATFPVHDNNFGALPTAFALDAETDANPWDYLFGAVSVSPDPVFTDLWAALGGVHQALIAITGCYCIGDGIARPGLTINRPAFPRVTPLPFFWISQSASAPANISVRTYNATDKLPPNCCTAAGEGLAMEYSGGELQATLSQKEDLEYRYRSTDVHSDFRQELGFPRWCCLGDDCGMNNDVRRYLHFPRWLNSLRDPYAETAEEPIGVLPVIVDIQCNQDNGTLHVFRANLLFHDGILYDVQWDASSPRESGGPGVTSAPTAPADLPYDEDYDGAPLLPELVSLSGAFCDDLCVDAADLLGETACEETCPADVCATGYSPDPITPTYEYETPVGNTESGAQAVANAKAAAVAAASCAAVDLQTPLIACYVKLIAEARWKVGIALCCED